MYIKAFSSLLPLLRNIDPIIIQLPGSTKKNRLSRCSSFSVVFVLRCTSNDISYAALDPSLNVTNGALYNRKDNAEEDNVNCSNTPLNCVGLFLLLEQWIDWSHKSVHHLSPRRSRKLVEEQAKRHRGGGGRGLEGRKWVWHVAIFLHHSNTFVALQSSFFLFYLTCSSGLISDCMCLVFLVFCLFFFVVSLRGRFLRLTFSSTYQ